MRSRASEDAYPTMMLKKDQTVTVVSIKGQWLKIVPPPGSFAYIPKSYVMMRGDGTVGRMKRDWIAHVGSTLNEMGSEPMATIHADEDVQIIGQHNEYFKIKPPTDSYLWVNKQFVEPLPQVADATPKTTDEKTATPTETKTTDNTVVATTTPEVAKPDHATIVAACGSTGNSAGARRCRNLKCAAAPAHDEAGVADAVAEYDQPGDTIH